ncbi:MAG: TonB-dependent receptor [candidate division WOR-3 bacterium]|nr:MAG: TonB-dependent receptor [candidate division WOR-3 bacterium]
MRKYVLIAVCLSFAVATNFGQIKGRVVDERGEPLIDVNIMVEGTEAGAASDENGEFHVYFLPVSSYSVTASYLGYTTVTTKNVIVHANQTTELYFQLKESIITIEPMVVTAESDMVIKTQTQTQRTITAADIDKLPISEINQIITLQAGVSVSERGIHVRGGRSREIAYYIDGILTKAPHYGTQSLKVSKQAVEEVAIQTGGFDAEYGEAMSGVINVVTREGSENLKGLIRVTTDEVFSDNRINYGYNRYELNLGGGIMDKSRFRFFLSGEAFLTDAWEETRYRVPSERFDYKVGGKLSYRIPQAKGRLTLSTFYSREQYMYYQDVWGELSFIYNLDRNFGAQIKNFLSTITCNFIPAAHTMLETKFGYTTYNRFRAVRDLEADADRRWYEDYNFKADHFVDIISGLDNDSLKKLYLVDSLMAYYEIMSRTSAASLRDNPFGATGLFYTVGDQRSWRYEFSRDYHGLLSLTRTFGRAHEFKSGIILNYQNVGWYDNNLPYYTIPFWDIYEKDPLRIAVYVQDRMDFEGIIARIGCRFDYFDSKASGLQNPADNTDSTLINYPAKWRISPRIGFSLPVTDRSKFRFNYGHFFQTPTSHDLYRSTTPMVVWLLLRRYNSVLGNADLTVEKTVAYEIGYENQFSDLFAFGIVAYYKDIYDLIQTKEIINLPYSFYQVYNLDYGNVKGVEFTMKKRMADYWSFDLSYTLQFAKGTASDAWQHYYEIYLQDPDPITGEYAVPKIDYWLDFDERHIINSSLGLLLPGDFVIAPLQDVLADFLLSYHSGFPYTPQDLKGRDIGDQNSARMPGYINVDANISKDITVAGLTFSLFTQMYNLFNTEQIVDVYNATGRPDTDGGEVTISESDFRPISLASYYYTPQADYNHDGLNSPHELYSEYMAARSMYYNNPLHWRPGFRARVGISLKF